MLQWQKEEQILTRVPWVISLTWKQFQSINMFVESYDNIERAKNSTFSHTWELNGPYLKKTCISYTRGCFVPNNVEIGPVVLKKNIFKISSMYFCHFVIISPLKMVGSFKQTWIPIPSNAVCQVLLKLAQRFWRRRLSNFALSLLSPLIKSWALCLNNLNPLYPRMLSAKFGWYWLWGSREEDFKISSKYFCYFLIISPWK